MNESKAVRRLVAQPHLGFTLVEMVVCIAIIGVLAAIAIPGMRQYLDSQAIRSACSELADSLALGRAEAIRRSAPNSQLVIVGPVCSGAISNGWTIFVDSNGDQCYGNGDQLIQRSTPPSRGVVITPALTRGTTSTSNAWIGFNGQGMAREPAGNFIAGTYTCSIGGSAATNAVLTINSLGRIRQSGT